MGKRESCRETEKKKKGERETGKKERKFLLESL